MALAANALTTLARVLDELGLASDSGAQDARLERYIDAASALAARYCNRIFERDDAVVDRIAPRGGPFLHLERLPVLSVTSVVLSGTTLAASDYELHKVAPGISGKLWRATGWPWATAEVGGPTRAPAPGYEQQVAVVTYSGGYVTRPQSEASGGDFEGEAVTLPADLEDAVIMLAATRWQTRGRDRTVSAATYENQSLTFGGVPVPPEIVAVLDGYAFPVVA